MAGRRAPLARGAALGQAKHAYRGKHPALATQELEDLISGFQERHHGGG